MVMSRDRVFEALHDAGVTEDVATWMADLLELDRQSQLTRDDLDVAVGSLRTEMENGFALLRTEMDGAFAVFKAEVESAISLLDERISGLDRKVDREIALLRDELAALEARMRNEIQQLRDEIGGLRTEMRWVIGLLFILIVTVIGVAIAYGG